MASVVNCARSRTAAYRLNADVYPVLPCLAIASGASSQSRRSGGRLLIQQYVPIISTKNADNRNFLIAQPEQLPDLDILPAITQSTDKPGLSGLRTGPGRSATYRWPRAENPQVFA
jgi:hypothetical protein